MFMFGAISEVQQQNNYKHYTCQQPMRLNAYNVTACLSTVECHSTISFVETPMKRTPRRTHSLRRQPDHLNQNGVYNISN